MKMLTTTFCSLVTSNTLFKRGVSLALWCLLMSFSSAAVSQATNKSVTPYTGKKLVQASQLAQEEHLLKAIEVLNGFTPNNDYDKALVNRVLGIYYWQAEQPKQSIRALTTSTNLHALEPKAQWQTQRMLGDILYSQQNFAAAVLAYQKTLAVKYDAKGNERKMHAKEVNQLYFRIAASYYQQQNWQQVRRYIAYYRAPDAKQTLQALRMQVVAELRLKQWKNAEMTLADLIRLEPNNKGWWQQQISVQLQQKRTQAALETYALAKQQSIISKQSLISKQALTFNINDYKTLAQLYAQNKIPERAARILDDMFAQFPDSKTIDNQKRQAQYWQIAREWPQAISAWQSLAHRDAQYYWPLTQLLIQQKHYAQANKVIDQAKPYAKFNEFALAKIQLLYRLDKYNDALAQAKRLNEKQPSASAQTWIVYLENKLQ
ncbi:hypothetical protein HC723_00660 [Vibrio sp. S11_S32]|nr:hypothetical protein [Vibrio sp. S11_S32]